MITVACVLRSGGCYTPEYVRRLREGVEKHLPVPHTFVCLSDVDVPGRIPLENDWHGWWAKIELFRLRGKVLYFDLDTVINGDLTEIATYPHKFTMLRDFNRPSFYASGVMAWEGDYSHLYTGFDLERCGKYGRLPLWGDGGYIQDHLMKANTPVEFFQDLFPGQIVSYKKELNRAEARVVCYHGKPRPHETGWKP